MANGIIRLDEGWRLDAGHHLDQPPTIPLPVTPPKKRRRSNANSNIITTMSDFIPTRREDRRTWLLNISDKAAAQAVAGGGTAPQGTALKAAADAVLVAYEEADSAKTTFDGKKAVEKDTESTQIAIIRTLLKTLKVLPTFISSGADAQLQSSGSSSEFEPDAYKPVITVSIKGGHITFEFKKKGVDALVFYGRLRGSTTWTKLAVDTSSPYIDGRPLAVPGVAEVREYMARGMIDDEEIGLESDIVSLTYGG
ncbi:MAG: hypothetical protein ABL974_01610 [Prosthecobacter sp.]